MAEQYDLSIPCIFEVKEVNGCSRGGNRKFDHKFDPKIRGDVEAVKELLQKTSKRINKCAVEMVDGKCPNSCFRWFPKLDSR